jgi:hypothetical protein
LNRSGQREIDMDRIVGKRDAAIVGPFDHAGVQQGVDIARDHLHVAPDAALGEAVRRPCWR